MGSKRLLRTTGWGALLLALMLALTAIMTACSSGDKKGDSSSPADTAQPAATSSDSSAADDKPAPSSGSAKGTLAVDGKTFDFTVIFCGFSADDTGNDNVPFSFRGSGSDNGRSFAVDASTTNLDVAGSSSSTDSVSFWYDDDPATEIYTSDAGGGTFVIDGKHVKYDADFSGQDGLPLGAGSMDATCP